MRKLSGQNRLAYIDEFREKSIVLQTAELLKKCVHPGREYRFMEFCGGHTHVIFRYGLKDLIPPQIQLIHGPGCPVCVLPRGRIDSAIQLTRDYPGVILCTYADLMRVPGSEGLSLIKAKAQGADIRMVYSPDDALQVAQQNPDKKVVFLAIGFETTAPATAFVLNEAKRQEAKNFSVYCLHLLTPPVISRILEAPDSTEQGVVQLDGFIGPGHVSSVIGAEPFEAFVKEYQKPVVITGFSPLDLMQALVLLVIQVNELAKDPNKTISVQNQYKRAVGHLGNRKAQKLIADTFEFRPVFEWRGLGQVPRSGFQLREEFAAFDAEKVFKIQVRSVGDHPACACSGIIRGLKTPLDCKLFAKACTPDHPIGSCMVSSEGTCAAYYTYRKGVVS